MHDFWLKQHNKSGSIDDKDSNKIPSFEPAVFLSTKGYSVYLTIKERDFIVNTFDGGVSLRSKATYFDYTDKLSSEDADLFVSYIKFYNHLFKKYGDSNEVYDDLSLYEMHPNIPTLLPIFAVNSSILYRKIMLSNKRGFTAGGMHRWFHAHQILYRTYINSVTDAGKKSVREPANMTSNEYINDMKKYTLSVYNEPLSKLNIGTFWDKHIGEPLKVIISKAEHNPNTIKPFISKLDNNVTWVYNEIIKAGYSEEVNRKLIEQHSKVIQAIADLLIQEQKTAEQSALNVSSKLVHQDLLDLKYLKA